MGEMINDPINGASQAGGSAYPIEEVKVDLTKLNALSPEVIINQATVSFAPLSSDRQTAGDLSS